VKFAPVLVYSRGRRLIPISISDKFATLIQRIAPTPAENSAFSSHLKTVSAAAEAVLEINRTERIGSFSRGTAVRGISDLDLMVVLSSNERKWGRGNTTSVRSRRLTHFSNPAAMRTFDITPDDRRIVFDRSRENSDILLIDLAPRCGSERVLPVLPSAFETRASQNRASLSSLESPSRCLSASATVLSNARPHGMQRASAVKGFVWGGHYGSRLAGSSLRTSHARQEPGLYPDYRSHAGFGYRR
jgi:hypothetical protein